MNRSAISPLDYSQDVNEHIGGLRRLRLAYTKNIIAQRWATETEIKTSVIFKTAESWIADFADGDFSAGQFSIEEQVGESGRMEIVSLKVNFETGLTTSAFRRWYDKNLKSQKICVEITDNDCKIRAFNPLEVTYRYINSGTVADTNKYELTFTRAKLSEGNFNKIINVSVFCNVQETGDVSIRLLKNNKAEYLFGYSLYNNVETVAEWFDGNDQAIWGVPSGNYFGFAKHKTNGSILNTEFKVACTLCRPKIGRVVEILQCKPSIGAVVEITPTINKSYDAILGVNV
jgi:hypothetical protein